MYLPFFPFLSFRRERTNISLFRSRPLCDTGSSIHCLFLILSLYYPFSFPIFLISLFPTARFLSSFRYILASFSVKLFFFFIWFFYLLQLTQISCLSYICIIKFWPDPIQFSLTFLMILNTQLSLVIISQLPILIFFSFLFFLHHWKLLTILKHSAFEIHITLHWFPSQLLVCLFSLFLLWPLIRGPSYY